MIKASSIFHGNSNDDPDKYFLSVIEGKEQAEEDFIHNIMDMGKPEYMIINIPVKDNLCDVATCPQIIHEFWRYDKGEYVVLCKYHAVKIRSKKFNLNFTKIIKCMSM